MGRYKWVAQGLITSMLLVTILVTTFLPDWVAPVQAAPTAPNPDTETAADLSPVDVSSAGAAASLEQPSALVSVNALVLSAPGQTEALEAAITQAGDSVHVRQGDALFVGLDALNANDLVALGARAIYRGSLNESELAGLSGSDRAAALTWNAIHSGEAGIAPVVLNDAGANSSVLLVNDPSAPANGTSALYSPSDTQTSMFLYGKVAVKVLFVESTGSGENWMEAEVNKVKTEIVQGLDWWTVAATTPAGPGELPRPQAQLVWDVSYVSPFDGSAADKEKIQIGTEPIVESVFTAAANWIPQVAAAFTGLPANPAAVRKLADTTRDSAAADWGFVLFVVDSSDDPDGFFTDDLKAAGAALNGPWAVVTYDGGDLGTDNLEVLVAKMVGHVFGAGDETYGSTGGCYNEELYGYLRIAHDNCERAPVEPLEASLMRDGQNMFDAYSEFQLSESARGQVGWLDSDADGLYDVVDTLSDSFTGIAPDPVCPTLHLADTDVNNVPALPAGIVDPVGAQWGVHVWDPEANSGLGAFQDILIYTPANINRPSFAWGRINNEDWVAGAASDGVWDEEFESYTLSLLGDAGAVNQVEVAIMDRWAQVAYMSSPPVEVTVAVPPSYVIAGNNLYESNDTSKTALFDAADLPGGWTDFAPIPTPNGYSGNNTQISNGVGSEACFAFNGFAVKILYSKESVGSANVFVDGELHSTIQYTIAGQKQAVHYIANLLPGDHTVQIEANTGVIDFDAFVISDPILDFLIDTQSAADFPLGAAHNGFYEHSAAKVLYAGAWNPAALDTSARPAPRDNAGLNTIRPYDRIYAYFTHANIAAIYRKVFPGGGTAYVYVDGEFRGIMNNDAKFPAVMPFYVGGLDPNEIHAIELRVNPDAPSFDFDALRLLNLGDGQVHLANAVTPILNVPYNGAHETYGVWEYKATGTYIQANDEGDLQNVFFKGSAVAVLVRTNTLSGGIMDLYADGRLVRTVNLKTKNSSDAPIVLYGFDSSLPHVLQIRHHNENPASPKWSRIDGYRVYYIPPVGPGEYEEYEYDIATGTPTESVFIYEQMWKFPAPYLKEPGPSQDRYIETNHSQSRAYLYFTGADTVTLYAVAKTAYGSAELWVDGKLKGSFYLKSGTTKYNVPYTVTGMNPAKEHVLEIRIKDQKAKISIDRVVVYNRPILTPPNTYQNDGEVDLGGGVMVPAIQLSGQWTRMADGLASGGTFDMGGSIEDQVIFSVKDATSVVLYRRLYVKYGKADVYVDGQYHVTFDNYVSSPDTGVYQEPFVISGLDPAFNHEIKIVPQRTGPKLNKYKPFDIDYIVVRAGDTGGTNYLTPGFYENNDGIAIGGGAISYVGSSWVEGPSSQQSTIKGEKAVIVFQGNALTIFFDKASNGGKANISIDGKLIGTFNSAAGTTVLNVPYSVGGLSNDLHTAEIYVQSPWVYINAFQVYNLTPASGPTTFDLNPLDSRILVSEEWYAENGYLKTNEQYARLLMYVTGGDTLFITHESWSTANNIEVYINGKLHSTLDAAYLRHAPLPEATYILSGLTDMQTEGFWVEFRNPKGVLISLKQIDVGSLTPALAVDQSVEAEGPDVVHPVGYWLKRLDATNPIYSGGFYLQSASPASAFYIPTEEGVRYITVYRSTGSWGDAKVYIDGEFWGVMPNKTKTNVPSAPFTIGPIPNTPGNHIVEIRQATNTKIGLDRVVGHGSTVLPPGTYEDTDPRFLYTGAWLTQNDGLASGGSLHKATKVGDQLTATFMGNEISFIYRTSSDTNLMTAYIDGDAYPIYGKSGTPIYGVKQTILVPGNGPHSLVLHNTKGVAYLDKISTRQRGSVRYGAYQNDSSQVVLNTPGFWTLVNAANHSGGTYSWTLTKYASAFLLFYGQQTTVYMSTGNDWGKMSFYLDGQLYNKVVQYVKSGPLTPFYAFDISGLTEGNHVLQIRFEGERDGSKGKKQANFDVITVDGAPVPMPGDTPGPQPDAPRFGCYEEDNDEWLFFGPDLAWTLRANAGASGNQYYEAGAWENTYGLFRFAATGFSLVYHKGPQGGDADVYVDGDYVTTLDMFAASDQWLNVYTYPGPALNATIVHSVEIVQAGSGNIYVDRIDLPSYDAAFNDACPD